VRDTTEIEKKSLEAHVELCAERYRFLEEQLESVEEKVTEVNCTVNEVKSMVQVMSEKRTDQILNWGLGIIGVLTSAIAFLLVQYVFT
jgi:Glu-tRNA(Gln) amidotransferase subunit E-like FAD-binding protein